MKQKVVQMKLLLYGTPEYDAVKGEIQSQFSVIPSEQFDAPKAARSRIDYLKNFLKNSGRKAYILGISGGVDSSTVGRLCQIACCELRGEGYQAQFIAMRLPAGVQRDEADAQKALYFINPDKVLTVNVGEAATIMSTQGIDQFINAGSQPTVSQEDWLKGNIKARLRMIAQYQAAAFYEGLVVSTDMNSEFVMSFFTLHGDGASDVTVLGGLNKRQVRLVAKELGASNTIWNKISTADLEELRPGKTDSEGFGFEYDYLDDFLEKKEIPFDVEVKIVNHFNNTRFKREGTPGFKDGQ